MVLNPFGPVWVTDNDVVNLLILEVDIPSPTGPNDGVIAGWSPSVNKILAILVIPPVSTPVMQIMPVYEWLAQRMVGGILFYAIGFHNNKIDVFDSLFKPVTTLPLGAFADPRILVG